MCRFQGKLQLYVRVLIMFQLCTSLDCKTIFYSRWYWLEGEMEKAAPTIQKQRERTGWSRQPSQDSPLITNPHPLPLTAKQPHLPPCPNLPSKIRVLFFQFNTHEPSQRGECLSCAIPQILHIFSSLIHPWERGREHFWKV